MCFFMPCVCVSSCRVCVCVCVLQALGVSSSQDRALIKKKVKDLKVLVEKARRSRDKQEKLHRKELDLLQKHTRKPSETAEGAAE